MSADDQPMTLDDFLAQKAGLDPAGILALRKRLEGSRLLTGCEALLQFKPHVLTSSATRERLKAQAMLQTAAAQEHFDALIKEGYKLIPFDLKMRWGVIVCAHLLSMMTDLVKLQELHGPLKVENLPPLPLSACQ